MPDLEQLEEMLSINAAVVRTGRPRSQIVRAIMLSELPAKKSGERVLISAEALERFVAEHPSSPRRSA